MHAHHSNVGISRPSCCIISLGAAPRSAPRSISCSISSAKSPASDGSEPSESEPSESRATSGGSTPTYAP